MKKLSIVLAFVMLVSFVACSSQSEAPAQTTTGAITTKAQTSAVTTTAAATTTTTKADATTEVQNPFAEKMTINWLVGTYSSHLYEEGRWDELELEEKFNVDIKMWNILVDSNNMEQVQMML